MPSITIQPVAEALKPKSASTGFRSQRTTVYDELAVQILDAIEADEAQAPVIDFEEDLKADPWKETTPSQYIAGLRAALKRQGEDYTDDKGKKHSGNALADDILTKLVRGEARLIAWKMRPEDEEMVAKRRARGQELYAIAQAAREAPQAPKGRATQAAPKAPTGRRTRAA